MRDPFKRASRRIVRRLGKFTPIVTTNEAGEVIPDFTGIYDNPEEESLVRGKSGGLTLKRRGRTLRVLTEDVPTLSKAWTFTILGGVYYPAHWDDDGDGCTLIYLSVKPAPTAEEDNEDGTAWR
jgi:hypothetical protein